MQEKTVLVAGTFDILHESHINMLKNARNQEAFSEQKYSSVQLLSHVRLFATP